MPNIEEFKAKFIGSGARANLFKLTWDDGPNSPTISQGGADIKEFLCKISSFPASSITPLPVQYQGRTIKLAGTRPEYADWTITVMNDEDMAIRRALESWMFEINSTRGNTMSGGPSMEFYKRTAQITGIGKTGDQGLGGYKFYGLFPSEIGEVTLDWSNDAIQEYTVTWSFDYFEDLNNSGLERQ